MTKIFISLGFTTLLLANQAVLLDDTNIRMAPSINGDLIKTAKKGTSFKILKTIDTKKHGRWHQIEHGFIYAKNVDIVPPTGINPQQNKKTTVKKAKNKTLYKSQFEDGKKAYAAKEYQKAIEHFKNSKKEYGNADMQLLWAKSEEKLNRINYAIAAYERVISIEPENLEATMSLIKLYKDNAQDDDASKVAQEFDDKDLTPEQRTVLAQLLSVSHKKLDKLTARIATKMGYDSNIASTALTASLDSFADKMSLSQEQRDALKSAKGTLFSQTLASVSYTHDLENVGGWFAKANANVMMQLNSDAHLFDTRYLKALVALGYKINKTTITVPVSISHTHYLDKDLLQNYGISPTLSSVLSSKYIFNFTLKLDQKKYLQDSMSGYDSQSYGLESSLYYIAGKNYISAKLAYSNTDAAHKKTLILPPKYIDNQVFKLSLAALYRLKHGYTLNASYNLNFTKYDENYYGKKDSVYYLENKQREDTNHSLGLIIGKYITKSLKATANTKYTRNKTRYYISDYGKYLLSVGLEYNY